MPVVLQLEERGPEGPDAQRQRPAVVRDLRQREEVVVVEASKRAGFPDETWAQAGQQEPDVDAQVGAVFVPTPTALLEMARTPVRLRDEPISLFSTNGPARRDER